MDWSKSAAHASRPRTDTSSHFSAFEELSQRCLGEPLPPRAAGSLFRLHADDGQRFAGLLLAAELADTLTRTHDDDWFRNPRAAEELRAECWGTRSRRPVSEAGRRDIQRLGGWRQAAHVRRRRIHSRPSHGGLEKGLKIQRGGRGHAGREPEA